MLFLTSYIYKAMLKLTNSFCRYLKLTYENIICISKNQRESYAHLSCTKKAHSFTDTGQHLRLQANKKKRLCLKQSIVSNDLKIFKPMSEPLQPNLNHVSYGGQFHVSTDDDSPGPDWQKQYAESGALIDPDKNEPGIIPPNFRVWEPVSKKNGSPENTFKFKILSYNMLAQYLLECHPYLYTGCSPNNLKWKVRAAKLYEEITNLAPDILCLQEVQASHLNSFYMKFEQIGYVGIYKQKTGHRQDGCAIYYKQSLFEMEDQISVEFYQPELPLLNRDNIGIMVKLIPRNCTGSPIVVATTHLLYNPKRTDVRLAQMQVFLAEIDRFAYYNNGRESGHLPIILTGDLNSTPDSAVIKLLDRGHVSASQFRDSSDWKRIGVTDNCQHLSVVLNRQQGLATDFSMTKIFLSSFYLFTRKCDEKHCMLHERYGNYEHRIIKALSLRLRASNRLSFVIPCLPPSEHNVLLHADFRRQRKLFRASEIHNSDYSPDDLEPDSADTSCEDEYSPLFNSGIIGHSLKLQSTYNKLKQNGHYEATTFQDYWVTVDYIYFSCCSTMRLVERLRLPTVMECSVLGPLPNDVYGSDHLALAAIFELKTRKTSLSGTSKQHSGGVGVR